LSKPKHILLIGEYYAPIIDWLKNDAKPQGVPAIYNFYNYLGNAEHVSFDSIIYNPDISKTISFPNGSTIELKKFYFPGYYFWKAIVFIKLYLWGKRKMKQEHFDLVYGFSTFSTVAHFLGNKFKKKSAGRILGTILTKDFAQKNYFKIYTRYFFDVLAMKYPCDYVITTMDGSGYDKVFPHFNKNMKIHLLANGMEENLRTTLLNIPHVNTIPKGEKIKLCYVARLEEYKRVDRGLKLVKELLGVHGIDNIHLTILGSGSKEDALKQLCDELDLNNYVTFKSAIPHEELPDFLATQHAGMFFYQGGSIGNILWETALSGRLVLTINNGDTGTVFKDMKNCLIADEDGQFIRNMATKLVSVLDQDITEITASSRKTARDYVGTWEERFDREMEIIFP